MTHNTPAMTRTHKLTINYITRILTIVTLPILIYILQLFSKTSHLVVIVVIILFCLKVIGDALTLFPSFIGTPTRVPPDPNGGGRSIRKGTLTLIK